MIGLSGNNATGTEAEVDLRRYNWWNEALHGVAHNEGSDTYFQPPTEFATVFPQILNLASSFNKHLFLQIGNATGTEAR